MNKIAIKVVRTRNHIRHHRAKYASAATLTVCAYLAVKRADEWNEFLAEHDLTEEFYHFNEE